MKWTLNGLLPSINRLRKILGRQPSDSVVDAARDRTAAERRKARRDRVEMHKVQKTDGKQ